MSVVPNLKVEPLVTASGIAIPLLSDGVLVPAPSRILIVDDDEEIQLVLQARLAAAGFHTLSAYDGREGLQYIQEFKPDVIFLDVAMAKMNGLEVLEQIRAQDLDIAVIITTAHGSE